MAVLVVIEPAWPDRATASSAAAKAVVSAPEFLALLVTVTRVEPVMSKRIEMITRETTMSSKVKARREWAARGCLRVTGDTVLARRDGARGSD